MKTALRSAFLLRTTLIFSVVISCIYPLASAWAIEQRKYPDPTLPEYRAAIGSSLAYKIRQSYGARTEHQFYPELVTFGYLPLPATNLHLRGGARIGYSWLQPEMPESIQIVENDLTFSCDAGLVYDWYLVPSLSAGAGFDYRTISLKTATPVMTVDDQISGKEWIPFLYAQVGVGLPFARGLVLAEPWLRYLWIQNDWRTTLAYGIEVTIGF